MKTVIEMAKEAGFMLMADPDPDTGGWWECFDSEIETLASLVRADEREACAKVCDDKHDTWRWDDEADSASGPRDCAAAIRARSNK